MSNECKAAVPSVVEIKVTTSQCPAMPEGDVLILEGPSINYQKSGPVCITALNAIYPWVMLTRFGVKTELLDFDEQQDCYHAVCPCGIVSYDIRKINK